MGVYWTNNTSYYGFNQQLSVNEWAAVFTFPILAHIYLLKQCPSPFLSLSSQYIHHRLIHLTPADYDDFVNIIRSARSAFCLTPVGMMQFNDVLQNLKRGKQTKELWQRISLEMATFSPWEWCWPSTWAFKRSHPGTDSAFSIATAMTLGWPHLCCLVLSGTTLPTTWTHIRTRQTGSTHGSHILSPHRDSLYVCSSTQSSEEESG